MRVPFIARWPGRIKAGRVESALACNMDLFPTFLALAGGEVPDNRKIDGIDMTDLLLGKGRGHRDSFCYYRGTQSTRYDMAHGKRTSQPNPVTDPSPRSNTILRCSFTLAAIPPSNST